jgi:hypothetical protein
MSIPDARSQPETTLQKEARIFREQFRRIVNCALNKTFELTVKGSRRRSRSLVLLFIIGGIFFTLRAHPLEAWRNEFSLLFQYLFIPSIADLSPDTPQHFLEFTFGAALSPRTLRFLPLFLLPFFIALQSASIYLADIFEIEKPEIARDFIMQVALTGSHNSIRIGNGDVVPSDQDSPIYLIGGPGRVVVELDTAALFERPNGRPRVIGPTVKGKATLEGFERFRQAIDLRDQYTDPLIVKSRSLDGIPVTAKDVRLLFSVARGDQERNALNPHPFSEQSIERLVYGQASKVISDGPFPSEPPSSWTGTIQGLIRSELGGFMSRHRLADYLASIGAPEVQKARQREDEIIKVGNSVLSDGDNLEPRDLPPLPNFQPRHIVSSLFSQFTEGFSKNAQERGVRLEWIGIGIWRTPNDIVLEKHLEAWKLSRENLGRGRTSALEKLHEEAQIQQILRLVQNVPLARFKQNLGNEPNSMIRELLLAYREQLIEAIELLAKSKKQEPVIVREAIKHIERVLGIKHWVGATSSHAPYGSTITPNEEGAYEYLVQITGNNYEHANRMIEEERKRAPDADRKELIKRAIERFWRDNL